MKCNKRFVMKYYILDIRFHPGVFNSVSKMDSLKYRDLHCKYYELPCTCTFDHPLMSREIVQRTKVYEPSASIKFIFCIRFKRWFNGDLYCLYIA